MTALPRCRRAVAGVLLALGVALAEDPAAADPVLVPRSAVGAAPPVAAVADPQVPVMPQARRVSGKPCTFRFAAPPPVRVRHVAPCGSATSGTGAPDRPWRRIEQALVALKPGDVAYVHDDPSRSVYYEESAGPEGLALRRPKGRVEDFGKPPRATRAGGGRTRAFPPEPPRPTPGPFPAFERSPELPLEGWEEARSIT